jgi:hypothetical protein
LPQVAQDGSEEVIKATTAQVVDNGSRMEDSPQHEQITTPTSSESDRDEESFGQAAEALAGAGLGAGGSLAEVQVQRLIEWAKVSQRLIAEADFEALPLVCDETGEHEVRFRDSDRRVIKRTWTGTFGMVPAWKDGCWKPGGATPLDYIRRFVMHNALFQDDVRLEGIIISDKPSLLIGAIPGGVSMVISQRWLIAADPESPHPTEEEIRVFMNELGFEAIPGSFFGWFNETTTVLLLDAKPDNLIKTSEGILPFDVLLMRLDEGQ